MAAPAPPPMAAPAPPPEEPYIAPSVPKRHVVKKGKSKKRVVRHRARHHAVKKKRAVSTSAPAPMAPPPMAAPAPAPAPMPPPTTGQLPGPRPSGR
jgi:hypothetical protein